MIRSVIKTTVRNRKRAATNRRASGATPSILSVAAVGGEVNQIEVTFNMETLIYGVPAWTVTVGGSPVEPVAVVSHGLNTIVLDYGEDVSTATTLVVPENSATARSQTGQRVAPGVYPLS